MASTIDRTALVEQASAQLAGSQVVDEAAAGEVAGEASLFRAAMTGSDAELTSAETSNICYDSEISDPADAFDIDLAATGILYDCGFAEWIAGWITYDSWNEFELDLLLQEYDLDGNLRNGCDGADRGIIVLYDSPTDRLVSGLFDFVSCDDFRLRQALPVVRDAYFSDHVFVIAPQSALFDKDLEFGYRTYSTSGLDEDFAPDTLSIPDQRFERVRLCGGVCYFLSNRIDGTGTPIFFRYGSASFEVFSGDWNGDGVDTIGVRTGNRFFLTDRLTGGKQADYEFAYGSAGDEILIGDWNADGKDTIGVRKGNTFYLSDSFAGGRRADHQFSYGSAGDLVVVGDWNADNVDTLGVRKGNTYYLTDTLTGGRRADHQFSYGSAGDQVLIGDWNADGVDTLGVRKGNVFYLTNTLTGGRRADHQFAFGSVSDRILVGDWNNDGVDTIGVRR
ncbi:MAG: hypothetical protein ACLGIR_03935 [Actinomycetes bacterium]